MQRDPAVLIDKFKTAVVSLAEEPKSKFWYFWQKFVRNSDLCACLKALCPTKDAVKTMSYYGAVEWRSQYSLCYRDHGNWFYFMLLTKIWGFVQNEWEQPLNPEHVADLIESFLGYMYFARRHCRYPQPQILQQMEVCLQDALQTSYLLYRHYNFNILNNVFIVVN